MRTILLSSFLVSVLIHCTVSDAQTTPDDVLDIDGKKLQSDVAYHIQPAVRGLGGGLIMTVRNGSCPLYVAQESNDAYKGSPLKFLPVNTSDKVIHASTDLNILFDLYTICAQPTVWQVGDVDIVTRHRYLMTNGLSGNPGSSTVNYWFKIEKYKDDYKLVFCPSVCSSCKVICGDVGVFIEDGNRWLGLSEVPLPVKFLKL